jgi:hypothetical protein
MSFSFDGMIPWMVIWTAVSDVTALVDLQHLRKKGKHRIIYLLLLSTVCLKKGEALREGKTVL